MMFNVSIFLETLPVMGLGMAGIFIVFVIIYLLIVLFNKLFPEK